MPTACAVSVNHSACDGVAAGAPLPVPAGPLAGEGEPPPIVPSRKRLAALPRGGYEHILLLAFRAGLTGVRQGCGGPRELQRRRKTRRDVRRVIDPGRLGRGDAFVVLL